MTNLTLRAGSVADAPAVIGLLDNAMRWLIAEGRTDQWGETLASNIPSRVAHITRYTDGGDCHIALAGTDVVGALVVGEAISYVPPATEPELYVKFLVADRSRPGLGVGGLLLDHAATLARQRGLSLLRVDCFRSPDRSLIEFYERHGFTSTEEFTVDDGKWAGQVLERRLD
ncbi:GNAT family N-acetyltransferase [Stackebrandtia soli]|uniref:GNAT family N-acetyltransferase n=1 Tax=Stackebrandtia soli TaxID=1892856 RepID=UPI0039E8A385